MITTAKPKIPNAPTAKRIVGQGLVRLRLNLTRCAWFAGTEPPSETFKLGALVCNEASLGFAPPSETPTALGEINLAIGTIGLAITKGELPACVSGADFSWRGFLTLGCATTGTFALGERLGTCAVVCLGLGNGWPETAGGLDSFGLDSFGLDSFGLDSFGLDSLGLESFGLDFAVDAVGESKAGKRTTALHFGHFTFRPMASGGTFKSAWQDGHVVAIFDINTVPQFNFSKAINIDSLAPRQKATRLPSVLTQNALLLFSSAWTRFRKSIELSKTQACD